MELTLKGMMAVMFAFIVFAVIAITLLDAGVWGDLLAGLANVGGVPSGEVVSLAEFTGAIAFAGAGGTAVLLISNYVRDKNLGMGARVPRIVSPITGQEEAGTNVGFFFRPTDENMRRWRAWWRVTNLEQFLTFFLFTILTICVMSALASATLAGQAPFQSFDFIEAEGQALGLEFGGALRLFFLVAGLLALFSTNLAVGT